MPSTSSPSGDQSEFKMTIPEHGTFTAKFEPEASTSTAEPVEKQHVMNDGETSTPYTSITGKLPIEADFGNGEKTKAHFFFVAYLLDKEETANRPLMFVFNGGPGSSSVWLHLGALGPRRVQMQDEGWMPPPPYQLVDNEYTWLHEFDLVFIDPVGTGFSQAENSEDNDKFWNIHNDVTSLAEFIRRFLTKYNRWNSPLFLTGESYGTTRGAGLAGALFNKGVALNGLVLLSPVLNFQTLRFTQGNDLPYTLYLPTYAATNWYHKHRQEIPDDASIEEKEQITAQNTLRLTDLVNESRNFAGGTYSTALVQGEQFAERDALSVDVANLIGLPERYIQDSNLRINIQRFCKQLMRNEGLTVGRLDSRFRGVDEVVIAEFPEFDPSYSAILPPFTATFNHYVREELGYEGDEENEYQILSFRVNQKWTYDEGSFPDTSAALHSAMKQNPYMQVFVGMGYFDLATPFYAIEYTLDHLGLQSVAERHEKSSQHAQASSERIHRAYYEAGHMMYLDLISLEKLQDDIMKFKAAALLGAQQG